MSSHPKLPVQHLSAMLELVELVGDSMPADKNDVRDVLIDEFAHQLGTEIATVEHWLQQFAAWPPSPTGVGSVTARIVRCRHGQPLVILDDRPFNGLEIRPHELERLGEQLIAIARLGKQHKGKQPTKVVMG